MVLGLCRVPGEGVYRIRGFNRMYTTLEPWWFLFSGEKMLFIEIYTG